MNWIAQAFLGQSALEQEVRVEWADGSWILHEQERIWQRSDVELEVLAGELHVSHKKTKESFVIKSITREELKQLGMGSSLRSRSHKFRFAIVLFLVTLGTFLGLYAAMGPLSYAIAESVPSEEERQFFDHVLPLAFLEESRCRQWDAQNLIQSLGDGLNDAKDPPASVEILNWKMANAFAFPGRRIYVTQGLLDKLTTSEQLLAILAHEKGHLELRHNLAETIHSLLKIFLWSIAVGDFSGAFIVDPSMARDMADASYSRERERDADLYGAEKLLKLGHDPKALGEALIMISKEDEDSDEEDETEAKENPSKKSKFRQNVRDAIRAIEGLFSSHPTMEKRQDEIATLYPNPKAREPLSPDQWKFLKEACKLGKGVKTDL